MNITDGSKSDSQNILSRIEDMEKVFSSLVTEFSDLKNKLEPVLKSELFSGETTADSKTAYSSPRLPSGVSVKLDNFIDAILILQENIRETRLRVDV